MADFKELGDKAHNFAKNMAGKANDAVEVQKLKSRIRDAKQEAEEIYSSIGKVIYARYKEGTALDGELANACQSIDEKNSEIAGLNDKIDTKKGCVRCPECGAAVSPEAAYCSKCGASL